MGFIHPNDRTRSGCLHKLSRSLLRKISSQGRTGLRSYAQFKEKASLPREVTHHLIPAQFYNKGGVPQVKSIQERSFPKSLGRLSNQILWLCCVPEPSGSVPTTCVGCSNKERTQGTVPTCLRMKTNVRDFCKGRKEFQVEPVAMEI